MHNATGIDLKHIMLREKNKPQKDNYCVIPII